MAIACAGYRLDVKGSHHQTAFEALRLAVGKSVETLADSFEANRRKRNRIEYDRAHVASCAETEAIIKQANELRSLVEDWISKKHSSLEK